VGLCAGGAFVNAINDEGVLVPESVSTRGGGVDDWGDIVGWYDDADGVEHGFAQHR
jgi:hypothetical protein